ncbi:hypothetical protein [uncultured Thiodictyon sp.]|uniref:type IV secretory system conjugative DNA transfer family protein n=1 Tax=uncultured Thiodictyon sp. TaxID=1846217 RepID=UPI0025FB2345|nr:hypothetical protein [uncultured Thiodictyon sp.]
MCKHDTDRETLDQDHTDGLPTASDTPPIRVFPTPRGTEARFALILSGVDATAPADDGRHSPGNPYSRFLPAWPPLLAAGEGLDLIYRIADGGLKVLLRARAQGADPDEATGKAVQLWHNLQFVLEGARLRYAFTPTLDDSLLTIQDLTYRLCLEPVGYRIIADGANAIGFTAPAAATGPALLIDCPSAREPRPCDTLVHAVAICRARAQVCIALDQVYLDPVGQAAVSAALAQFHGSGAVIHGDEGRRPVRDRAILKGLEQHLMRCQRNPSGLRLVVTVSADQPPPATLLALLGAEIFQGRDLTWSELVTHQPPPPRSPPDALPRGPFLVEPDGAIDLRGYVPAGTALWPPLPSLHALRDLGLPPLFADRVEALPETGILLGHVGHGERARPVRFAPADRGRHCYLLGATGTGKSTLLFTMLMQDIRAGAGLCLLDPHADLTEQVLDAIPANRLDDVILFDPADPERAAGLNFLETDGVHHARQMNFITNEMIRIFGRLYDLRQTGGPMFEQYMRNALLLLMDDPEAGTTLVELPLLFEDKGFRRHLLKRCRSPHVASFWTGQAERAGGEAALDNMGPYITSKLNQFTHNAALRPIIGQSRSTIDFRACMDQGKILLVKLSKGQLGTMDTQLLGMLVIGKLFDAALGRVDVALHARRPFHLYVDEAQNFVTDTVADLLSEARKFGLHLTLANQNLAQMAGQTELVSSLLGNVGTLLLFRLGILDAERLANFMRPELGAHHLQDLPNYHVAARLLVDGRPSRAFVFRTEPFETSPPDPQQQQARRRQVRQRAAAYTRAVPEVEREIQTRRDRLNGKTAVDPDKLFDPHSFLADR